MENLIDWTVCRLCLEANEEMKSIQDLTYNTIPFYNIYFEIIGIPFADYEAFPGKICTQCQSDILQAYTFKEKVLETEDKLKELYGVKEEMCELFFPSATVNDDDIENEVEIEEDSHIDTFCLPDDDEDLRNDIVNIPGSPSDSVEVTKEQKVRRLLSKLQTKSIKCKICYGNFKGLDKFNLHKCCKSQNYRVEHERDLEQKAKVKKLNECKICNKRYGTTKGLMLHMDKHKNVLRYSCRQCDMKFSHWLQKRNHVYKVHLKQKYCECSTCGMGFDRKHDLRNHINSKHLKLNSYQCEHCGKVFRRIKNLGIHVKTHMDKRVKCEICKKELKTRKTLLQHMRTHSTEKNKNYICPVCAKGFTSNFCMKSHVRKKHPYEVHLLPPDGTIVNKNYLKKLDEMNK